MGVGEAVADKKTLENAVGDMIKIAGQKPVITKSRKSIARFKSVRVIRWHCMVTLRKAYMYEFLNRLYFSCYSSNSRFFEYFRPVFDGRGNFNMGVKEQIIFPEIEYDKIDALRGLTYPSPLPQG